MAKDSTVKEFEKALGDNKTVSTIFLGIGLCLFLLNVTSMLSFLPNNYSFEAFYISIFSSMVIILFATYELHRKNGK